MLLILYSILFSTRERGREVRGKIVSDMTIEVHVSDLCCPFLTFFKTIFQFFLNSTSERHICEQWLQVVKN